MTFAQPFQDYEILDRVGAGAMGTVFKARQKRLNRIVALKVLKPSLARDSRYVDRLRREARIVASLNHPYIVSGYDLGEEGGYHYFVMEFVEGKSLRGLLLEWGMFAEEYVRRVARQTAMALDHAYQRGVIHRDIKPGNILIDEAGNVKLTDMGLAKGPADLTLTRDGATVGTPQYISPEQARNPHDVDVRSDLYSLGATLYHMAAGVPPYRGDTMAELITNVLGAVPTPPNEINPALSDGLSLIIRKLLVKDLTVRYQTPQELLDDLDRIDRSQPPKVDAARLAAEAAESSSWLGRGLLAVAILLLLGVAWWVGVETRQPAAAGPTKEQFLVSLESELESLPTPGARLRRLDKIGNSPIGTESAVAQQRRVVSSALDVAVNGVVEQMRGNGWAALKAWLNDPLEWPDRDRFDREKLAPELSLIAGVPLAQVANTQRVKELELAVDRALAERDAALVARFELFLVTTLPARVQDQLRANDFRGAFRLWQQGLALFFESVHLQPLERLPESVRKQLKEKHLLAQQQAASDLDLAEKKAAENLLTEADAVVNLFRERLHDGEDPDNVRQTMRSYRQELETMWPAAERFRAERNPWPEVDRKLGTLQAEVSMAEAHVAEARLQQRFDLAWRTLCHGRASDALAVLVDAVAAAGTETAQLQQHRRAFEAAAVVEASVLAAVARANTPPVAFPCVGSGQTFELRIDARGNLVAQAIGQAPRQARLTEFRFSDLLKQLVEAGLDPFEGAPANRQALGQCVLRLVGDDLTGLADLVQGVDAAERSFLIDDVAPRVQRVREQRLEPSFDRETMLKELIAAREAAQAGTGTLVALLGKMSTFERRTEGDRTSPENVELHASQKFYELAHKREDVRSDLERQAPHGAEIVVRVADNRVDAEVGMGIAVLAGEATDGWQQSDGAMQYAGTGRPWSELSSCLLQVNPGFEATALHTRLQLDVVLPPVNVGARFYLIEFRGIDCALVVAGDGGVHAALVEGDARREENAQRAFQRALASVISGAAPVMAVPGAVHRLTIDVKATTLRTRAQVHVAFEGVELCAATAPDLLPQQPPTCVIYPLQEIAVQRIVVQALDL